MSFWFVFPLSCCISPWLQPFVRLFGISVFSHSLRLAASPGDWQAVTVTSCQPPREAPGSQAGQQLGTEVLPPCSDPGWGNTGEQRADVLCALVTYCPFWGPLGDPSSHRASSSLSLCRHVSARSCTCHRPCCSPAPQTGTLPAREECFTLLLTSPTSWCFPFACQM